MPDNAKCRCHEVLTYLDRIEEHLGNLRAQIEASDCNAVEPSQVVVDLVADLCLHTSVKTLEVGKRLGAS